MVTCDVVIVGGGPAGSSCAWKLQQAGLDVAVVDKARFPRDKVCAGWITPQVIEDLRLDLAEYAIGRTFQPITGFRVGLIGGTEPIETAYQQSVSFGIRRCEFDDYLLRRSGARLFQGITRATIARGGAGWMVGDLVMAPMLVGAGGHQCPVARMLDAPAGGAGVVSAQEAEVLAGEAAAHVAGERPELYFNRDLTGYGWCFRKGEYLNIGFGRLEARELPAEMSRFVDFLDRRGALRTAVPRSAWRGHGYLLGTLSNRTVVADAVLLAGDAAGLAYAQSGEGIRPAIESGLMAADTIIAANRHYARNQLAPYARRLRKRFGAGAVSRLAGSILPSAASVPVGRQLLGVPWFVRHVVLDRWFLHASDSALAS
jgi:menaquinone-9 beta-reductase